MKVNMNMKIVADAKATLTLFPRKSSAWLKLLHHSIIAHVHELEEANTRELERLLVYLEACNQGRCMRQSLVIGLFVILYQCLVYQIIIHNMALLEADPAH